MEDSTPRGRPKLMWNDVANIDLRKKDIQIIMASE